MLKVLSVVGLRTYVNKLLDKSTNCSTTTSSNLDFFFER